MTDLICAYCGMKIEMNPINVGEVQRFSKRFAAGDTCVSCRQTFYALYNAECDAIAAGVKKAMEKAASSILRKLNCKTA